MANADGGTLKSDHLPDLDRVRTGDKEALFEALMYVIITLGDLDQRVRKAGF